MKEYRESVKKSYEDQRKAQESIASFNREVLNMHLYDRDSEGKIVPGSFRLGLIQEMNLETFQKFSNSLSAQEKELYNSQMDRESQEAFAAYNENCYEEEWEEG